MILSTTLDLGWLVRHEIRRVSSDQLHGHRVPYAKLRGSRFDKYRTIEDKVPCWCQADVKVSSVEGPFPQISKAKLKQLPEFAWYSRQAVIAKNYRFLHQNGSKWGFLFWLNGDRTWICQKYTARCLFSFWYEVFKSQARWLFILIWLRLLPCFALLRLPSPRGAMLKVSSKKKLLRQVIHPNVPS